MFGQLFSRNCILIRSTARVSGASCRAGSYGTFTCRLLRDTRPRTYPPNSPPRPRGFSYSGTARDNNPDRICTPPQQGQKRQYSSYFHQERNQGGRQKRKRSRSNSGRSSRKESSTRTKYNNYYAFHGCLALGVLALAGSPSVKENGIHRFALDLPDQVDGALIDYSKFQNFRPLEFWNHLKSNITSVTTCLIGQEGDGDLVKASPRFTSQPHELLALVLLNLPFSLFWTFESPDLTTTAFIFTIATSTTTPYTTSNNTKATPHDDEDNVKKDTMTTVSIAPGRPETLTAEQEAKLKELWSRTLELFGRITAAEAEAAGEDADEADAAGTPGRTDTDLSVDKKKKKKFGFHRSKKNKDDSVPSSRGDSGTSTPQSGILSPSTESDDKYGLTKEFRATIASMSSEELRNSFAAFSKFDHPDALLLRFLRARKWDVEKALVMMVSTIKWRQREVGVEDLVMKGELDAVKSGDEGFMKQLRMGKSFIHGVDREGRPICVVRVHLHKSSDQAPEAIEKYTVYLIETARIMLTPPVDTACVLFDMSKFGLANMDYNPVKFMIKCFEAHYPESLGVCLVHKAPWIFQSIWSIIKGWLDPVVASKIHFTKSLEDLEKFIPKSLIIKELEGDEDWEYKFVEPSENENDAQADTATRDKLQNEREELYDLFEANTRAWVNEPSTGSDSGTALKDERKELVKKLRENYWQMDKYIRAKTWYDRTGVVASDGKIDFYGKKANGSAAPAPPGADIDID